MSKAIRPRPLSEAERIIAERPPRSSEAEAGERERLVAEALQRRQISKVSPSIPANGEAVNTGSEAWLKDLVTITHGVQDAYKSFPLIRRDCQKHFLALAKVLNAAQRQIDGTVNPRLVRELWWARSDEDDGLEDDDVRQRLTKLSEDIAALQKAASRAATRNRRPRGAPPTSAARVIISCLAEIYERTTGKKVRVTDEFLSDSFERFVSSFLDRVGLKWKPQTMVKNIKVGVAAWRRDKRDRAHDPKARIAAWRARRAPR